MKILYPKLVCFGYHFLENLPWVGLGWGGLRVLDRSEIDARSKNSSLALFPPFTHNRCHFGRGDSSEIFSPLQEQSLTGATLTVNIC